MKKSAFRPMAIFWVWILCAAGCSGVTAPSRFYVLSPLPHPDNAMAIDGFIGVHPVRLPEYLDQPLMVTRIGPNELRMGEFDRWAEPLKENFTRVLIDNLCELLGADKVLRMPTSANVPISQTVSVEVVQFDATAAGDVILSAKWRLFADNQKTLVHTKMSTFTERVRPSGYQPFVAAGSRALGELSDEIAESIREKAAKKGR